MPKIKDYWVNIAAYILVAFAIVFGFLSCIISVFSYTTFDIGPDPDQIRDAFVYMNMWHGKFPILGPAASIGGYQLPPLYYYLVFPFTILGADPVYQALANAVFSFLSILLLMYLVYQILENVERERRLLLAGLSGFWYSLIFAEIFIATFQWNPTPVPLFLIIFALLYKYQLETIAVLNHL